MGTDTQEEAATPKGALSVDRIIQFPPKNLQWHAQIVIFLIALSGAFPHYRNVIVGYVRGVSLGQLAQGEEQRKLGKRITTATSSPIR
jgi:hypothetical protein